MAETAPSGAGRRTAVALAEADLSQRKQAAAKLAGRPGAEGRAVAAEGAIQRAREDVDKARRALEVVTARVTRELQRFKALRAAELRRAIASYVALQAEHSAALRDQWAELLPEIGEGAPPLPPPPAEEAVGV